MTLAQESARRVLCTGTRAAALRQLNQAFTLNTKRRAGQEGQLIAFHNGRLSHAVKSTLAPAGRPCSACHGPLGPAARGSCAAAHAPAIPARPALPAHSARAPLGSVPHQASGSPVARSVSVQAGLLSHLAVEAEAAGSSNTRAGTAGRVRRGEAPQGLVQDRVGRCSCHGRRCSDAAHGCEQLVCEDITVHTKSRLQPGLRVLLPQLVASLSLSLPLCSARAEASSG